MKNLFQLAYVSSAVKPMAMNELEDLLATARANNRDHDITGMLLYADGSFLQILEGDETQVRGLYQYICQDNRHTQTVVIHESEISKRAFPDWSMGFRLLDLEEMSRMRGFSDLLQPDSSLKDKLAQQPTLAYRILLAFSECSGVVPDVRMLKDQVQLCQSLHH